MYGSTDRLPIRGMLAVSILTMLAVFGVGSWLDYLQIRDAAFQRIQSAAFLMEEHAIGTLDAAHQVVQRAMDLIGEAKPDDLRGDDVLWFNLRRIADTEPVVVMLRVLNERGDTVFETTNFPSEPINLSEGAYFQEPRDGAGLYVGAAVMDPTAAKPVFTLSRRLEDRSGRFTGVVLAAIDTTYFNRVYQRIHPAPQSSAGLIRQADGAYLAREPTWDLFVGRSVGPWDDFVAGQQVVGPGLFMAPSPIDHVWRYYAHRPVPGYPLVVFAGESVSDVLGAWRRIFVWMAAASLLGTAGIAYFGWSARRAWQRERQAAGILQHTNARLQQALADKDVLFREVHHRVKNNLQVVGHLLLLQAQRVDDPQAKAAFQETLDRVRSVSAVHQVLYRSNQAVEVELDRYLADLCASLADSYGAEGRGIAVQVDAIPCRVHIDQAIPLALIVNEAVTNAFKYAFGRMDRNGALTVALNCSDGDIQVRVIDNGIGLPEDAASGETLGMNLIRSLVEQLDGCHAWHGSDGTRLEINVPRRAPGPVPAGTA